MSDALYSRLKKETQDMLDLIVIVEDRGQLYSSLGE